MPNFIGDGSLRIFLKSFCYLSADECIPSLEFCDECAIFGSFDKGDFIGMGLLINSVGVSNGCANDSS